MIHCYFGLFEEEVLHLRRAIRHLSFEDIQEREIAMSRNSKNDLIGKGAGRRVATTLIATTFAFTAAMTMALPASAEIGVSVGLGGASVGVGIGGSGGGTGGSGHTGGGAASVGVGLGGGSGSTGGGAASVGVSLGGGSSQAGGGVGVGACVGHCSGGTGVQVGVGTGTGVTPHGVVPGIPGIPRLPVAQASAVRGGGRCAGGGNSNALNGVAVFGSGGDVLGWVHDAWLSPQNKIEMIKMQSNAKLTGAAKCFSVKNAGFAVSGSGLSTSLDAGNFRR